MSKPGPTDVERAFAAMSIALGVKPGNSTSIVQGALSGEMARAITRHRLSRLVVNSPHPVELAAADLETVTNDALAHTHAAFQLVGHTTHVARLLEEENIDFLVIKGIALGALSQTPAGRGAGDVDILVDPADVPRVHEVFRAGGFRPALALPDMTAPRTWRVWQYFDREATYVGHNTHIDLHWRISSQRHLFPDFATLSSRATTVSVADSTIPTLSQADSLAAACYHAYFDQFQPLRSLVDVVMLIRSVDPGTLSPTLSRRLTALMAGVIAVVADVLPGVVDTEAAALLAVLPTPPRIVRQRFDRALRSPKVAWEERQHTGDLLAKLLAEAHFDSPIDALPRFIGKRLFHFPTWSPERTSTTLLTAATRRWRVESSRRRPTRT